MDIEYFRVVGYSPTIEYTQQITIFSSTIFNPILSSVFFAVSCFEIWVFDTVQMYRRGCISQDLSQLKF